MIIASPVSREKKRVNDNRNDNDNDFQNEYIDSNDK